MSSKMHTRGAGILAVVLIGLIILSFLFTGYYTRFGTATVDVLTTVDGEPIKIDEFQRALQQRLEFFKQLSGGQELSSKQLEQLGIKSAILSALVEQKLMIKLAKELKLEPSSHEVADLIQEQKYFQRGERFDFELYQKILNANGLNSSVYEKNVAEGLMASKIQEIFNNIPTSEIFQEELSAFKKKAIIIDSLHIKKSALKKSLSISSDEIEEFLKNKSNLAKIEARFLSKKEELSQEEQVKAKHILLAIPPTKNDEEKQKMMLAIEKKAADLFRTLTTKNFEQVANEHTEDPNGKGKGGELGWFGRGMMTPEFEEVVFRLEKGSISRPFLSSYGFHIVYLEDRKEEKKASFSDHKYEMAKSFLQETKTDKLKSLELEFIKKGESWLKENQWDDIKKQEKNLNFTSMNRQTINILDGSPKDWDLDHKQVDQLFRDARATLKGGHLEKVYAFSNVNDIVIVKNYGFIQPNTEESTVKTTSMDKPVAAFYEEHLIQELRKTIMDSLQKKANIKHLQKI